MFRVLCLSALMFPLAACSAGASESDRIDLATTAIKEETGDPTVSVSDSFFGENKGGAPALCGTVTGAAVGSSKFVVIFLKDGEVPEISRSPTSWPTFCDDAAKLRYKENH